MATGTGKQMKDAKKAFDNSYRVLKFCNWCGSKLINRIIHHGDNNPVNNDPHNLWALCSNTCHGKCHSELLGRRLDHSAGGKATADLGGGLKKLHADGYFTSERQSEFGKAGVGECKAKGARVANAIKITCPDCNRVMNPGAFGMHKRVHLGGV